MVGKRRRRPEKQRAVHLDLSPTETLFMTGIQVICGLPAEPQGRHADAYDHGYGETFLYC